jgi:hypothetical protein
MESSSFLKKFEFYEFAGVLAPGVVTVYGLARIYPDLGIILKDEKVSFGELGLLLILAFVAGHLIQAFGNLIEIVWWKCSGGKPSDWVRTGKGKILAASQAQVLPARIRELLRTNCPDDLHTITPQDWFGITRQVYATVRKAGRADRVDIFAGNYGLFRGVAAGFIVILVATYNNTENESWKLYAVIALVILLALDRMHRFGVHYARELFVQFIDIQPGETMQPKKAKEAADE